MRNTVMCGFLFLAAIPGPLRAQGTSAWLPAGTALGITIDRFDFGDDNAQYAASFHISSLDPVNLTPEFALSIFQVSFRAASLVSNVDMGGAFNIPLPRATLLLRGGVSGLLSMGLSNLAFPGAHYGATLLLKLGQNEGLRIDVLRRVYFTTDNRIPVTLMIGVGITSLPSL